jgi:hypothetical protein
MGLCIGNIHVRSDWNIHAGEYTTWECEECEDGGVHIRGVDMTSEEEGTRQRSEGDDRGVNILHHVTCDPSKSPQNGTLS